MESAQKILFSDSKDSDFLEEAGMNKEQHV
jgi:hypothetical protein